MKQIALLVILFVNCLAVFAQDNIEAKDKALLEELSNDKTFKSILSNLKTADLKASNTYKQQLNMAYLKKTPNIVKVFKREQAGLEGQFTETYFIVDHGKVKIVEAYFGDPFGSDRLRRIHIYTPEEIKLGYIDKDYKFIPITDSEIPKDKELFIGYFVQEGQEPRRF